LIADKVNSDLNKFFNEKKYELIYAHGISNGRLIRELSGIDCLMIRSTRKINREFLSGCKIKLIATLSKGTDHIDIAFASKRGIKIINSESGNTTAAAELTLGLILNILKNINFSDKLVRKGKFEFYDFPRSELKGKTVGIIGFGRVGSQTGKLIRAFGANIISNDIKKSVRENNRQFNFRNLDYLLKNSDIITIHIPLNKKNENFFDEEKISKMQKGVILINTSRGGIIDEEALLRSLKSNKIGYAGLDVFRNEPNIDRRFGKLKNVLLTNHIGGKTPESEERILAEIKMKVYDFFS
jgi:D-3-phosphoglycerate dehydrogenase